MDGLSVASLTSVASSVSQRALSGAGEIRSLKQAADSDGDPVVLQSLDDLVTLADLLEKASRDAGRLGQALGAASVVAERLQRKLRDALTGSEAAVAALAKQLMRVGASNLGSVYVSYIRRQQRVVLSYSDLFQYYKQIVALQNTEHQERRLETKDWQHLTEVATQAAHEAAQSPNTILSVRSSTTSDSAATPPGYTPPRGSSSRLAGGADYVDDEEEDRGGFGSLVSSLKAMMSSVLPKPDPLVCALCEAAARGDTHLVQGLIAQGASIDGKNENRDTPLRAAIRADQVAAAAVLIDAGADLSAPGSGSSKLPPLFQAAAAGHLAMARLLLSRGCDPLQASPGSGTPYFCDVVDAAGSSSSSSSVDGVRLLLEQGCDADAGGASGRKPIVAAARRADVRLVELLIAHGARVNGTRDLDGASLLAVAAGTGSTELVRVLLDAGADADAKTGSGSYVLAEAVGARNLALAHLLLSRGARGDRSTPSGQPLIVAAIRDRQMQARDKTELVRRLLERGAKATAKDNGHPALRYALESGGGGGGGGGTGGGGGGGLPDVVGMLLQYGAEPNKCSMSSATGETALAYAVRHGSRAEVAHLLRHGANVNEGSDGRKKVSPGQTLPPSPLVLAAVRRDADMIRVLRSHGAKLDDTMLEFARAVVQQPGIYESVTGAPPAAASSGHQHQQQRGRGSSGRGDTLLSPRAASPPPAYEAVSSPVGQ